VVNLPSDRLNLPSVLVLNGSGISHAGEEGEIAAFCAHVVELDLSHNKLQDWYEVRKSVDLGISLFPYFIIQIQKKKKKLKKDLKG